MNLAAGKTDKSPLQTDYQPGTSGKDNHLVMIAGHFNLTTKHEEMYAYTRTQAFNLINSGKEAQMIDGIIESSNACKSDLTSWW